MLTAVVESTAVLIFVNVCLGMIYNFIDACSEKSRKDDLLLCVFSNSASGLQICYNKVELSLVECQQADGSRVAREGMNRPIDSIANVGL